MYGLVTEFTRGEKMLFGSLGKRYAVLVIFVVAVLLNFPNH